MPESELNLLLQGCRRGNRNSQRKLYEHFYGYAMSICLRYSKNREEAAEILNDAFYKALTRLDQFDPAQPFKAWLRRILINSAIDYYRKNYKLPAHLELSAAADVADAEMPLPQIAPGEDLLPVLQQLSPAYRMVFNLFVMEGYKHAEIAEMLSISVGTSQSNLVRAVQKLRALMMPSKNFNPVKMN
jgi:RNA polymerase sigma-70 factor (ECF subfamily)